MFKSTFRKQINNFQIKFKKYNDTLNVAKNNLNFLHNNTNNTSTSSTIFIKKKYHLRFLSNDVRFLMLIFNTLIITIVFFFEKLIVDFLLFFKKFLTTLNHLFVFELFKQNISNFIVLFNSNFFLKIIQRNTQNKLLSMFTFNIISTTLNFIIKFFNDNLQSKKRREFLFNDFVVKSFRKFVFENLHFDNQKQTFVNFKSQSNTRKTIVEKIIY